MLSGRASCGDCGVIEGQIHVDGCDMERCAFCGHQRISCDCSTRHFYPKMVDLFTLWGQDEQARVNGCAPSALPRWERMGIPESVYKGGLPDEQWEEWLRIEAKKGRVPFILYPNICRRCGEIWPDMFKVTDADWEKYVQITERDEMLCLSCFEQIKGYIDESRSK